MINRRLFIPLFFSLLTLCASAQGTVSVSTRTHNTLNLEFTAGTTGMGLNLAWNINDMLRLRGGVSYLPRTTVPMTFNLMSYAGDDASSETADYRFNRLSELMESFTGMTIDREVNMNAHGTMVDGRLVLDVFPIPRNKHWYVSAGLYYGTSKVGHIENKITEAPSLVGVLIYNKMYDFFMNDRYYYEDFMGMSLDPIYAMALKEKFRSYGMIGAHVGDFKPDSPMGRDDKTVPYMLKPDEDGTISADMYVNHLKPYVGVGYTACVSRDGRWNIGFDAGILCWGKPRVLTHERYITNTNTGELSYGTIIGQDDLKYSDDYGRVNLSTDVSDIHGKVGTYARLASRMHVYPVLNFTISYKLF